MADVLILSVLRVMVSPQGVVSLALEAGFPGRCPRTVCFDTLGLRLPDVTRMAAPELALRKKDTNPSQRTFAFRCYCFRLVQTEKSKVLFTTRGKFTFLRRSV